MLDVKRGGNDSSHGARDEFWRQMKWKNLRQFKALKKK